MMGSEKEVKKRGKYQKIPAETAAYIKYLHQQSGIRGKDLVEQFKMYSRTSIYRIMSEPINGRKGKDKRKSNPGRPCSLTERETRQIIRQVPILRKTFKGCFTVNDLRKAAAVPEEVNDITVRRVLHREGYRHRVSAHKGVLTEKDLKLRLKFAKNMKKTWSRGVWWEAICFYLDGTGFTYKRNPCEYARNCNTKTWRKDNERLAMNCTARGKKEGSGGRVAKFMVAIAYNKGVTMCVEYEEHLSGAVFAAMIEKHFPDCFANSQTIQPRKLFLQDGDPSQNSGIAVEAMKKVGATKFSIPPRSPDLNPIENIFHLAKVRLRKEAMKNEIMEETYPDFLERITKTLKGIPVEVINKTILSMPKRVDLVIQNKGQRLKY